MDGSNQSPLPDLATWRVFGVILALLFGALVLEAVLSPHWTDPFRDPGTWVLIGVVIGVVFRGAGRVLTRWGYEGEARFRWLSVAVWSLALLVGLVSLLL